MMVSSSARSRSVNTHTATGFARTFPKLYDTYRITADICGGIVALCAFGWRHRETTTTAAASLLVYVAGVRVLDDARWALAPLAGMAGLLFAVPSTRRFLLGWHARGRSRRMLHTGLAELRFANSTGRLPKIKRVRSSAVGERMTLVCRPGQSAELLDSRVEELRAAARCRDMRITRDPNASHLVAVDVIRRDPFTTGLLIPWADLDADVLSMWDPVHLGTDEQGEPVRVSMVERSILFGAEPGGGKSSAMQTILSHAAKSPDAHLLLIDPNRVQAAPWRDRALATAYDDPADALGVLDLIRAEITRRLELLERLPGVNRKVTREIAEGEGLALWVLGIDELAFHTSVVGTSNQRGAFATACRDIVARGRAAGIIPVLATQRPTSDVVPTSLRDLISMRCALRTTTTASSDVILGEGWSRRGYTATDIEITQRGVGWLLAEGQTPHRMKFAWISDDEIADLSMTTVRHRPPAPTDPITATTAGDPATAAE